MAELNRVYPDGLLQVRGNYSKFLEEKEEFLHAQAKQQEALENLVQREIEWLRRGAKARTGKSKARIDKANHLIGEFADLNARTRTATAQIDFSAIDRKTKRLIELEDVGFKIGGRSLFASQFRSHRRDARRSGGPQRQRQDHAAASAARRTVAQPAARSAGPTGCASSTSIRRRELDPDVTLRRALAPEGDSVIYQDRVIHVAPGPRAFCSPASNSISRSSGFREASARAS